ncbi:hypothetical protein [Acinetobacter sp. CFCC 10889]|uniref:hypothetical protein n=1 Tax=Acinetobacter sp. CFCC 10889 TaxID=1775557 RepID=UPI000DD01A91|nr:hypothetical protein [Acinetobacter sp. CFCC 10889]
MEISKIKELALASGFKLKDQVNGEPDLNAYVYEFAQALEKEVLAQSHSVFGQEAVTINDTETLDSEITQISEAMAENHCFGCGELDQLEILVAKAMKLGELYERQKWQEAKSIPEGFVLMRKEATASFKEKLDELLFNLWTGDHGCDWDGFVSVDAIDSDEIWQMVIEASQENSQ